ncbi:hypothetical protein HC723_11640 [Vibrio sp. S11_S32]|uniref:ParB N-terminal domain-containing protein n=1 Tax=Vibrio sp. S11_S32 TaxID=2720225 RepID=UPI0016807D56|nr:ParB N-terminal domain-containing protein [Vibrio sp. S11_S32]MBD1577084.1 hypothetical protein [Vibrio sp. S11_S32]
MSTKRKKLNPADYTSSISTANRSEPMDLKAGIGRSNSELDDIVNELDNSLSHSKSAHMVLAGVKYGYTTITIPNDQIIERTEAAEGNERIQEWLNEFTLRDLIADLKESGEQHEEAIGYFDKDKGKIQIINGSRRRLACYFAGLDFTVNELDRVVPVDVVKQISCSTNVHKRISILEKGKKFAELIKDAEYDQKSIAVRFNETESLVSVAIRASQIPAFITNSFPYPSELGRNLITKLLTIHDEYSKNNIRNKIYNLQDELEYIKNETLKSDTAKSKMNAKFLEAIVTVLSKQKLETQSNEKPVFHSIGEKSKCRITKKNGSLKIELKGLVDTQGKKLQSELNKLLERYGLTQ